MGALFVICVIGLVLWFSLKRNLDAPAHAPIELSAEEAQVLEGKVAVIEGEESLDESTLSFTEKELNAWIAQDEELAEMLRVELDTDHITAIFRFPSPFDEKKNVKVSAALRVVHSEEQLEIRLSKVKCGAFRIPNAWLGELATENLVETFLEGQSSEAFLRGIKSIRVTDDAFIFEAAE